MRICIGACRSMGRRVRPTPPDFSTTLSPRGAALSGGCSPRTRAWCWRAYSMEVVTEPVVQLAPQLSTGMNEPSTATREARALTASSAHARTGWAVLAIAAIGWLLRASPLIQAGAFGYPIDYDEGVYFASSALLLKGVLPYRDFVFAHPPGLLYFLSPVAWLGTVRDPAFGFAAARWLATLIGCANILLVGRLAMRWAGPVAAIVAAAVYATHPEAVPIERGPFLEPVLNLCCLALASVWLEGKREHRLGWRALASGALCGLAASVKVLGAAWLV